MVFRLKRKVQTQSVPTPTGAILEDVLNLDIQRGHDSGTTAGWRAVTFPHETINPRVLGHSSPGSYALSRIQLATLRRADFVSTFSDNFGKAVSDAFNNYVNNHPIEQAALILVTGAVGWTFIKEFIQAGMNAVRDNIAPALYDDLYQPIADDIKNNITANFGPDVLTQSGWESGRALHVVQVRKVTNTSFEWYCYGTDANKNVSDINWIAIGTSLTPKQIPIPIQNLINQHQNQINQLQDELKQLKQQLGL